MLFTLVLQNIFQITENVLYEFLKIIRFFRLSSENNSSPKNTNFAGKEKQMQTLLRTDFRLAPATYAHIIGGRGEILEIETSRLLFCFKTIAK